MAKTSKATRPTRLEWWGAHRPIRSRAIETAITTALIGGVVIAFAALIWQLAAGN
ncbi:hypothetical protein ABZ468_47545 [Streptomyces sp. NPDC005708]|uniref:hypothetical protein n=1 Tax=Streptomyces sp. NPDC005708 TaxID=3154564 RepID=UPI0033E389B6